MPRRPVSPFYTLDEAIVLLGLQPRDPENPRAWHRKHPALWNAGLTPERRGRNTLCHRSEVDNLRKDLAEGRVMMTASGHVTRISKAA